MRGRTAILGSIATLSGALFASAAHGAFTTIAANDFESGADASWSVTTTTTHATFSRFLGRFGPESIDLTLDTLEGADLRLTFDLYILDNWKGDAGDHRFHVEANGLEIFNETLHSGGGAQSFLGEAETEGTNLGFRGNFPDAIYRDVTLDFSAAAAQTVVRFGATGISNSLNVASWGIDNVRVEQQPLIAIPSPGPGALASVGMALLLFSRPLRTHHRNGRPAGSGLAPA